MWLFNKKELILTHDFKKQAHIREILAKGNIEYLLNPILLSWSLNRSYPEYKFYVKKEDYEKAKYLISKELHI